MSTEIITPAQLAEEWSVNYDTVINLINLGELPFFKIGGRWRCRRSDLNSHITKSLPKKFSDLKAPRGRNPRESEFGG